MHYAAPGRIGQRWIGTVMVWRWIIEVEGGQVWSVVEKTACYLICNDSIS